ncbi:hypothetical protein OG563_06035 [Nocardia vinacea]|uniref:Uncharacterized protein n=1 Tax=Nocardia vinacea TaxID=96468 RepID=A0ABZ1YWW5_9NOCA|nr:hypothetical protein [Nocardia vinacea]
MSGLIEFVDADLPQRVPFVGPPVPVDLLPVELMERFAGAVREWAEDEAR